MDDCEVCMNISELLSNENVAAFMESDKFDEEKRPVQTAMCDNFKGWINFARNSLDVDALPCKPHATGNVYSLLLLSEY